MLCYLLVIASVLPYSFTLGLTPKGNKTKITTDCNDIEVHAAGDKFFECFNITVANSINHEERSCNTTLPKTISTFVDIANKSCYNDTVSTERKAWDFYNLLKFSLKYDRLKEFLDNGGADCVKAIKANLTKCVTDEMGILTGTVNPVNQKYYNLWKYTKLAIRKNTCDRTRNIKKCVTKAMRIDGSSMCKWGNNLMYVSSLFNFMMERCSRNLGPGWREPTRPLKIPHMPTPAELLAKDVRTTHVLLGLLLAMALLAFTYVLFRDCRASTGRWKVFNEQFQMRTRNRSLVNECAES